MRKKVPYILLLKKAGDPQFDSILKYSIAIPHGKFLTKRADPPGTGTVREIKFFIEDTDPGAQSVNPTDVIEYKAGNLETLLEVAVFEKDSSGAFQETGRSKARHKDAQTNSGNAPLIYLTKPAKNNFYIYMTGVTGLAGGNLITSPQPTPTPPPTLTFKITPPLAGNRSQWPYVEEYPGYDFQNIEIIVSDGTSQTGKGKTQHSLADNKPFYIPTVVTESEEESHQEK